MRPGIRRDGGACLAPREGCGLRVASRGFLLGLLAAVSLWAFGAAAWEADAEARLKTVHESTGRSGPGTLYRYRIRYETRHGIRGDRFAKLVQEILFDDRSWTGTGGVGFKQVARGGNTTITLASPRTVDRLCYPLATNRKYSCTLGSRVVLNLRRWKKGVDHWHEGRTNYRRMLVNHEVGHRIGNGHRSCPGGGRKAPVMQQQTISLQGCRANWWPTRRELRAIKARFGSSASAAGSSLSGSAPAAVRARE